MLRLIAIALCVLGLAACGDEEVGNEGVVVGGSCDGPGDCEFRCETGGDFPGGTCTRPCNVDDDCPDDSACISTNGGICLQLCATPSNCRPGYNCEGKTNNGHGGDSLVCIGD